MVEVASLATWFGYVAALSRGGEECIAGASSEVVSSRCPRSRRYRSPLLQLSLVCRPDWSPVVEHAHPTGCRLVAGEPARSFSLST